MLCYHNNPKRIIEVGWARSQARPRLEVRLGWSSGRHWTQTTHPQQLYSTPSVLFSSWCCSHYSSCSNFHEHSFYSLFLPQTPSIFKILYFLLPLLCTPRLPFLYVLLLVTLLHVLPQNFWTLPYTLLITHRTSSTVFLFI